jgi:O-antigen ligase
MVALVIGWAGPLTRGLGGRNPHAQLIMLVIAIPAFLALRPWRVATGRLVAAAGLSTAALLVCVLSPSGWSGVDVAGGYVIAAAISVCTLRYARTPQRRDLLAVSVCLAGLYQFLLGWLPWWRAGPASAEMTGSFFWYNPYAAFLMPAAVIGLALVIRGSTPWRLVGWITAPLCTAGVVLSSSRATLAVLLVAWCVVAVTGAVDRATVRRGAGVTGAAVGTTFLLPGPPFFAHYTSPLAATSSRTGIGQTLASSGHYRTEFWREALTVGAHHPLVGAGFHSLVSASVLYTPSDWARSQLAHNGYLQVWSEGGLLLAIPFLFLVAVAAYWAIARALPAVLRRDAERDLVQVATAVALLGAMAHSAVDFDWSHPSLLVEFGFMAAVVAPVRAARAGRARRSIATISLVALVVGMLLTVLGLHQWQRDRPVSSATPAQLLSQSSARFGDYRAAAALLSSAAAGQSNPDNVQLERALALTAKESKVDVQLALLRLATAAKLGHSRQALSGTRQLLHDVRATGASYVPEVAAVLASAGRRGAARTALAADINRLESQPAGPSLQADLQVWARYLGTANPYACELTSVRGLLTGSQIRSLPSPDGPCATHQ